jgi:hypothetical protein
MGSDALSGEESRATAWSLSAMSVRASCRRHRRLVQAAGGGRGTAWRGVAGGRSLRVGPGGNRRIGFGGSAGRLCSDRIRLLVRHEFVVPWRTRSRRDIVGHTTGPVRPMIRDNAGNRAARAQSQTETDNHQSSGQPLADHAAHRRVARPMRRPHRACRELAMPSDRGKITLMSHHVHGSFRGNMPAIIGLKLRILSLQASSPPDEPLSWRDCVSA